jgi:hypothetical protein
MSSAPAGAMLAHSVYFTLENAGAEARETLAAACRQLLSRHPGTVFFAVGTRAKDIAWSVSDLDFDVVLHLVFRSKADHDRYQDSPEHGRFLEENQSNWKTIRVFDAEVQPGDTRP